MRRRRFLVLMALVGLTTLVIAQVVENGAEYEGKTGQSDLRVEYQSNGTGGHEWRVGLELEKPPGGHEWSDWEDGAKEKTTPKCGKGLRSAPELTATDGETYKVDRGKFKRKRVLTNGDVIWETPKKKEGAQQTA